MRLSRVFFVLALVMIPGCGGCDSCLGTAQPGDEAGTAATSTSRPLAAAEAGAAAAGDSGVLPTTDGGKKTLDPIPYMRDGGGLPRPKAPMPLGDFQSCGVYEGPLCEKTCNGGACRQECDGIDCVLSCKAGYCSQLCGPTGKCKLSCEGGHCTQLCMKAEGCTKDCAGGACE